LYVNPQKLERIQVKTKLSQLLMATSTYQLYALFRIHHAQSWGNV